MAHSNKRLSIIVPVYGDLIHAETLFTSLQALRAQGLELILVNGLRGDEPAASTLADLVDVVMTTEPGRAHQMNAAAAQAQGDILLFLHADSLVPHDLLEPFFGPNNFAKSWGFFKVTFSPSFGLMPVIGAFINFRSGLTQIATGDQGIWLTKALFKEVGGYPDQLLMEDIALCSHLRRIQSPLKLAGTLTTSSRRWQSNGQVKTIVAMWWFRFQYWLGVHPDSLARKYYPHRYDVKSASDESNGHA